MIADLNIVSTADKSIVADIDMVTDFQLDGGSAWNMVAAKIGGHGQAGKRTNINVLSKADKFLVTGIKKGLNNSPLTDRMKTAGNNPGVDLKNKFKHERRFGEE